MISGRRLPLQGTFPVSFSSRMHPSAHTSVFHLAEAFRIVLLRRHVGLGPASVGDGGASAHDGGFEVSGEAVVGDEELLTVVKQDVGGLEVLDDNPLHVVATGGALTVGGTIATHDFENKDSFEVATAHFAPTAQSHSRAA